MSLRNGEKARAGIAKKRRTAQRAKDRVARAAAANAGSVKSEEKPAKAAK